MLASYGRRYLPVTHPLSCCFCSGWKLECMAEMEHVHEVVRHRNRNKSTDMRQSTTSSWRQTMSRIERRDAFV